MANINKIRLSGTTYNIEDSNATKTVELSQAEYNALVASGGVESNTFYIISDGEYFDPSDYYTTAQTQSAITQATSGKVSTSDFNTYSGSVDTALNSKASQTDLNTLSGTVTSHTASTTIHVTAQDKTNWNNKSDFSGSYNDLTNKLSAGTNITIVDNVISAEGGGGSSYTAGDGIDITNDVISVTGKVDTSAITTSVTSSSTDAQVPSAKAVNDKLGGLSIVKMTQSEYDALATKDSNTLYVING